MKTYKYSDSQKLAILNQAESGIPEPEPELCPEHGMSSATFNKWRAKYWTSQTLLDTFNS